jgi:plastocyanin
LLFVLVAGLVLAACGGAQSGGEPVSFTIDMKEYTFTPASLDLKVGQEVMLNLTNSGQLQHEILFGREVMTDENTRPVGYMEDMFATAGVTPEVTQTGPTPTMEEEEHEGFMVVLALRFGDQTFR